MTDYLEDEKVSDWRYADDVDSVMPEFIDVMFNDSEKRINVLSREISNITSRNGEPVICWRPAKGATNSLDVQEGGGHYKSKAIQPIQYIHANSLGFCEGNVVKYVTRHTDKNGIEDLKKARHYIDLLIDLEYKGT